MQTMNSPKVTNSQSKNTKSTKRKEPTKKYKKQLNLENNRKIWKPSYSQAKSSTSIKLYLTTSWMK